MVGTYGEVNDETYLLLRDCTEVASGNLNVAKMSPTTDNQHGTNNTYL